MQVRDSIGLYVGEGGDDEALEMGLIAEVSEARQRSLLWIYSVVNGIKIGILEETQ